MSTIKGSEANRLPLDIGTGQTIQCPIIAGLFMMTSVESPTTWALEGKHQYMGLFTYNTEDMVTLLLTLSIYALIAANEIAP